MSQACASEEACVIKRLGGGGEGQMVGGVRQPVIGAT
jgi:hypothetical protein